MASRTVLPGIRPPRLAVVSVGVPEAPLGETPVRRRFENVNRGHPSEVSSPHTTHTVELATVLPTLLFLRNRQSGASRRMESLVAWVKVTQKRRLRVVEVDVERHPALARELEVTEFPSLVLIKDRCVVGRLEGRATGRQIEDLIRPHLAA